MQTAPAAAVSTPGPRPTFEPRIEYGVASVGDLRVELEECDDSRSRAPKVAAVYVNDEPLRPSGRFWTSFFMRFGIGKSVFNYFDHAEVFERLAARSPSDRLRFAVERNEQGAGSLLAVSNPTKAVVKHDDLRELLHRYDGDRVTYHNGVVESHHAPRVGHRFHVSGDAFANRFVVRTPVDGFGQPNIYLSLLREVCSNGMIGEAPAFRSQLALGKGDDEVTYTLSRALDGFNNDEGYAALRQRFESAAESWASVHEAAGLYNLLAKLTGGGGSGSNGGGPSNFGTDGASADGLFERRDLGTHLLKRFHQTTGDVTRLYGLANADALSAKRQKTLPVKCKVYDLLNFATEVATHHAGPAHARRLHAWAGELVSGEYDLEGTADQYGDFQDFFVNDDAAKPTDNPEA
ncbi:DUF932 domain-containing protein [Alienimonas californiensis]|uniref:DUF932 domain-containing protein n=1 Tax=Alienimonas californiensis TaxID=2527989 RepID=A0A517P7R0_9PLAN|nr:DUF932 domain-containing protein [Alienimonas californiensis]QDT15416.1 hypothetical protein CA12_15010 [Alienimonas californiensis]